jgi:D-alanyl-D-alanine carboxypeptidase
MTSETLATSAIQAALDEGVAAGAPGAIIAINAPPLGIAFSGSSGLFAKRHARPLQPDDPFRAASVTKTVTAATAVRLAAEGHWELDSPITPFLPPSLVVLLRGLEGLENVDALTIRRLLSHTSGLPDYFFRDRFQARVQADPNRMWRPAELVEAAIEENRLAFLPGTDFSYGDTGYVLVGLAIERLVDRPLADAYRSLIPPPYRWTRPTSSGMSRREVPRSLITTTDSVICYL